MAMLSSDSQWGSLHKVLHWTLFLLVLATFVAVNIAQGYERGSEEKAWWMIMHRSFGVTAMLLMAAWLIVRISTGRPNQYGALWQARLSKVTHWGMVLLVLGLPLGGLLMSQFAGREVVIFHLFSIPPVLPESEALAKQIYTVHTEIGAPLLFVLILLHIGGALWHHFIDRDGTLRRMLPGGK